MHPDIDVWKLLNKFRTLKIEYKLLMLEKIQI